MMQRSMVSQNFPKVSMIILAYNHASYIAGCLESVAAVPYDPSEIVVLDDGSPDDTYDFARTVAARHGDRIRAVTQENTGRISENTQKLIDITDGEYILFMSGDDLLGPAYPLERIVARLEADPDLALVFPRQVSLSEDPTRATLPLYDTGFLDILKSGDPCEMLDKHLYRAVSKLFLQGVLIRRSVVEEVGGFDPQMLADDYAFMFRLFLWLAENDKRFLFDPSALWLYRTHDSNAHARALRQITLILEVVAKYVPEEEWVDFRLGFGGFSTPAECEAFRPVAVDLMGPKFGNKLSDKLTRQAIKSALHRDDPETLAAFATSQSTPNRLRRRASSYIVRAHLQRLRGRWKGGHG